MVLMANQTTNVNTGRYAPSVSYNQQAPQPINQRLENRVTVESPDWLDLADRSITAISKTFANQEAVEAEQQLNQAKNELARKTNAVAEAQRQGLMSYEAASVEYRSLADSYINVIGEKDVADIIGRYDAGIRKLDEDKQAALAKADNDYFEKQAAEISAKNPALQRMKPSDNIAFLQNMRNVTDSINNYKNALNTMPEGEAKENMKLGYSQLLKTNIYANTAVQMGNMFAQGKPLTEEDWFIQRQNAINAGVANGLTQAEASVLADDIAMSISQTGNLTDIKRLYKDNAEFLESANKLRIANASNRLLSLDEVALLKAMPEELQKNYLTKNYATFDVILRPFLSTTQVGTDGKYTVEGINRISTNELPALAQTVSTMNSSNMYNDYIRGKVTNMALSVVNNSNQLSDMSSLTDADNVVLNSDGVRRFVNIPLAKKQAMMLKNSTDPEEVATGEMLEQQIADFESNEQLAKDKQTAAKIVTSMSTLNGDVDSYRAINGLKNSFNAASLRFNDDGELFISNADRGSFADAAKSFDELPLVGGEYEEDLNTINQRLAAVEPGVRKEVLKGLGFKQAEDYELPLGDKATRSAERTIETSKKIAEMFGANTPIVSKKEMKEMDEAVAAGRAAEVSTGDEDLDVLYRELQRDLKPNVRRAVEKAIALLENR